VRLPCIIINVGVTLGSVTLRNDCRLGLATVLIRMKLWMKLIANWRKQHNVLLCKLYLLSDFRIKERKEGM
jgi:hypothetical protein